VVTLLSVAIAVVSAEVGLLVSFQFPTVKPSVLIVALSFAFYVAARLAGPTVMSRRRARLAVAMAHGPHGDLAELGHGTGAHDAG
jgi:hypothetical protein